MGKIANILSNLFVLMIKTYQYFLSPIIGKHCRFYPSCSCYAIEALNLHSCHQACYLILKRILSCHPWHAGGIDPVPEKKLNDY